MHDEKRLKMISAKRWLGVGLGVAVMAAAGGCASGLGLDGPEAEAHFALYTGVWVLDAEASDPLPAARRPGAEGGQGAPGGGGGAAGGRGGGGGADGGGFGGAGGGGFGGAGGGGFGGAGGGPPGGGGPGGRGPGGGQAGMTPDGMRLTNDLGRHRPQELRIELNDSVFAYDAQGATPLALPTSGSEVEMEGDATPWEASMKWDDRKPVLERIVEGGGEVVDVFESLTPDRMVLTRWYSAGPNGEIEFRMVFDRADGE